MPAPRYASVVDVPQVLAGHLVRRPVICSMLYLFVNRQSPRIRIAALEKPPALAVAAEFERY